MRINRAIAIQTECRNNLIGLYSQARAFCLPHSAMMEQRAEIYAKTAKAPSYVRAYLQGYCEALSAELYRDALVYGAWMNGSFYSTHRDRADYYEKFGMSARIFAETEKLNAGHYWAKDVSKPFFTDHVK